MQTRMVSTQSPRSEQAIPTNKKYKKLSKEDEVAAGGDENEVRREDQEKINRFSRLHQRESVLEALLQGKQVRFPFPSLLPMGYVDMVMLNQNRKIKKTSKKSPLNSSWRMRMSLFRMLSLSLSLSIYLFAYLDLWLTMIGTKSETPSSNSPWPKPRPSSLHRPRRPRVR